MVKFNTRITWDIEGEEDDEAIKSLPVRWSGEVEPHAGQDIVEAITDLLSETFGFCVLDLDIEIIG